MTAFTAFNQNTTASHASAHCAEASFSCAQSACNNTIITILDAIFVASIIICALISLVSVLVLGLSLAILVLVLLAVLLIMGQFHMPWMRKTD